VVAAAPFRDRVVHHALVRVIEPFFEPRWIEDSYACRKGKGTHGEAAREYLRGLRLEIHPDKYRALRCAEGVDFCGFVVRADGRVRVRAAGGRRFARRYRWLRHEAKCGRLPRRHQRPRIARSAAATGTTPRTTCAPRTGTTTTRRTRTTMWVSVLRGP